MTDLYTKNYADLNDEERAAWDLAYQVLYQGDRLYGPDSDHVGWALGLIIRQMQQHDGPSAMYFELVHDESGVGLAFILPEADPATSAPES